jgi:apolipoprotein N-acyltransferase
MEFKFESGMTKQLFIHAMLTGTLLALSGPLVGLGPLMLVAWVPLFRGLLVAWKQSRLSWQAAFLAGACAGLPLYFSLTGWIYAHAAGRGILLTLGLSLPPGLAALGIYLGLVTGLRGSGLALWITCLFASVELALGWSAWIPASASGYALWQIPLLIQSAELAGVFGVSFWVLAVNALGACLWQQGPGACRAWAASVAILSVAVIAFGAWRLNALQVEDTGRQTLQVALVQSTVNTDRKLERDTIEATLKTLVEQTRALVDRTGKPLDLVVWPETSVPVFLRSVEERAILQTLTDTARATGIPMLIGALAVTGNPANGSEAVYNAALLVPPSGFIAQEYHKCSLVPFYETFPLRARLPGAGPRSASPALTPGREPGLFLLDTEARFGVVICWEALSCVDVARLAKRGAGFLVNITNDDAAFGSHRRAYRLPLPHIVFRAIETRRPLLRCANRGLSLAVDRAGRCRARRPWNQDSVTSVAIVPGTGQTVFTRIGRVPAALVCLATFLWGLTMAGICVRRRHINRSGPCDIQAHR